MSESSNPKEHPCPDCGEMVRLNSLRCWNCGAFMNPELEQKYMQMQANPSGPILSQLPDEEAVSYEDSSAAVDEDDFELSMPVARPAQAKGRGVVSDEGDEPATIPIAADPDAAPKPRTEPEPGGVAHSVATGGDALLNIALQEEKEVKKKRKGRPQTGGMRTPGGGLIIFCPYGCRIEVKEQHRGMTGRCPKCRAPFIVPVDPPQFKRPKAEEEQAAEAQAVTGGFEPWINDLHLHAVNPEKLKLKADSLTKDFLEADFGFSDEKLLVTILAKKVGQLKPDKKTELRETIVNHLKEGKPVEEVPAVEKYVFSKDDVLQIKVVQPTATRADSIFMGIPVFGEGRIAVQLPITEQSKDTLYVSLGISQFWDFAKAIEEHYGLTELGRGAGIPPEHVYSQYKCHYTSTPIKALENLEFYKADPTVEMEVAGYRCGACGLTVSEAGRKKESLGGKSPKGIAKAKCPKCGSKMGENLLYALKSDLQDPSMDGSAAD